jgi:hypothetical protein
MFFFVQDVLPRPYLINLFGSQFRIPDSESVLALFLIILLSRYDESLIFSYSMISS